MPIEFLSGTHMQIIDNSTLLTKQIIKQFLAMPETVH